MKELSLNILDITENAVSAGATLTSIEITEANGLLTLVISDDGHGMDGDTLRQVTDPFYTTRSTRSVGMGLPLLKLAAEQTGGNMTVTSATGEDHGTTVTALFHTDHIDCIPLGDTVSTVVTLIQGHPDTDFLFRHHRQEKPPVELDTRQLRQILEDIPLNSFEILTWIRDHLTEQYAG